MVTGMQEYLSILQCLIYKAQKRQKKKQVLKFQKMFYKSQSIIFFIGGTKTLKNYEIKNIRNILSEPIFQKFLKICILKKQLQISFFLNTRLPLRKNLINFQENFNNIYFSTLYLEFITKKLFFINFFLHNTNLKLSYLAFYINSMNNNLNSFRNLRSKFLILFTYFIFLLFLPSPTFFLFNVNNKIKQLLRKNSKKKYLKLIKNSLLFHYQIFYGFYFNHHNYFRDSKKVQYQNSFYFHLLSNRKNNFFTNNKQNIKITKLNKNFFLNKKNYYKTHVQCMNTRTMYDYSSTILNYPFFRQDSCFISFKFLNNFFFKNKKKFGLSEIQLNPLQKKILFFILEPIWEACFEVSSYSKRRGRSFYDAVEFIRLNLQKQPMFLLKIFLKFFNKNIFNNKEKNVRLRTENRIFQKKQFKYPFIKNNIILGSFFFNFIENILFYGIQKQHQNYYLRVKQQIFLYQILKTFKQNYGKTDVYFYNMFYNKHFSILTIENQINKKFQKKKRLFLKYSTLSYKKYIIEYFKNNRFQKSKNKSNTFIYYLRLGIYFINNFLVFSLRNLFIEKIHNLKQRLFLLQLKKQKFSFYFQKWVSTFCLRNTNSSKLRGISFSIIYKDSNFFVSKNTFLYFFIKKSKNTFLNLLDKWDKKNLYFFKKIQNNIVFRNKLQLNGINNGKIRKIFLFSKKKYSARCNLEILLKINLSFIYGSFNSLNQFLNLDSFNNKKIDFLLVMKNQFFYPNLLKNKTRHNDFFLLMYCCNFYIKIFSFFTYCLKIKFIIFVLNKNDVNFIWNIFIKYENQILYFNSNYRFLKSFQTILQKWLICNKLFLSLYMRNYKKAPTASVFHPQYSISFLLNKNNCLILYLNNYLNKYLSEHFGNLSNQQFKMNINQRMIFQKSHLLYTIWAIKLFWTKEKHTFLFSTNKMNGLYFFNFFMFHNNKNHKTYVLNSLFIWQFYFLKSLEHLKYIKSFKNYYKIYDFIITKGKRLKIKQINQTIRFIFFQCFFLQLNYLICSNSNNFICKCINNTFLFKNYSKFSSFNLFKLIFYTNRKKKSRFILYKKLIQQKTLRIYYLFSIKPSKYQIQRHLLKIYNIIVKGHNKTQEYLIFKLSKNIKNWCYYYQIITPTQIFKYLDYLTLQILWRWACKHHYQKSKKWVKMKYFYKLNFVSIKLNNDLLKKDFITKNKKIVFASQRNIFNNVAIKTNKIMALEQFIDKKKIISNLSSSNFYLKYDYLNLNKLYKKIFICLANHNDTVLLKHKFIQNDRSPFDLDFIYWISRNFYY